MYAPAARRWMQKRDSRRRPPARGVAPEEARRGHAGQPAGSLLPRGDHRAATRERAPGTRSFAAGRCRSEPTSGPGVPGPARQGADWDQAGVYAPDGGNRVKPMALVPPVREATFMAVIQLRVPGNLIAGRTTRAYVRKHCPQLGAPREFCAAAALLASELVTHAISHARSAARLRVRPAGGVLRVEVGGDDPRHSWRASENRISPLPAGRLAAVSAAVTELPHGTTISVGTVERRPGKSLNAVLDGADAQTHRTLAGGGDGRAADGFRLAHDPRPGVPGRRCGRWPPTPDSVPEARRLVTSALISCQRLDLLDSAELIVSELATNAVLHSRTEFVVTVEEAHGGVLLSVADACDAMPCLADQSEAQSGGGTGGRGLFLVDLLSSQWGATVDQAGGKTVWALLRGQRSA